MMETLFVISSVYVGENAALFPENALQELPRHVLIKVLPYLSAYQLHKITSTKTDLPCNNLWKSHMKRRWNRTLMSADFFGEEKEQDFHKLYLSKHFFDLLNIFGSLYSPDPNILFRCPLHKLQPWEISHSALPLGDSHMRQLMEYAPYAESLSLLAIQCMLICSHSQLLEKLQGVTKSINLYVVIDNDYEQVRTLLWKLINEGVLTHVRVANISSSLSVENMLDLLKICAGMKVEKKVKPKQAVPVRNSVKRKFESCNSQYEKKYVTSMKLMSDFNSPPAKKVCIRLDDPDESHSVSVETSDDFQPVCNVIDFTQLPENSATGSHTSMQDRKSVCSDCPQGSSYDKVIGKLGNLTSTDPSVAVRVGRENHSVDNDSVGKSSPNSSVCSKHVGDQEDIHSNNAPVQSSDSNVDINHERSSVNVAFPSVQYYHRGEVTSFSRLPLQPENEEVAPFIVSDDESEEEEDGTLNCEVEEADGTLNCEVEEEDGTLNCEEEEEDAALNNEEEEGDSTLNCEEEGEDNVLNFEVEEEEALFPDLYNEALQPVASTSFQVLSSPPLHSTKSPRRQQHQEFVNSLRACLPELNVDGTLRGVESFVLSCCQTGLFQNRLNESLLEVLPHWNSLRKLNLIDVDLCEDVIELILEKVSNQQLTDLVLNDVNIPPLFLQRLFHTIYDKEMSGPPRSFAIHDTAAKLEMDIEVDYKKQQYVIGKLDLSRTTLAPSAGRGLCKLIRYDDALTSLKLTGCFLKEDTIVDLLNTLSERNLIQTLWLGGNHMRTTAVEESLLLFVQTTSSLKCLLLNYTMLSRAFVGGQSFIEAVRNHPHLKELSLKNNHLGNHACKFLTGICCTDRFSLLSLDLGYNLITTTALLAAAETIHTYREENFLRDRPALDHLCLSGNKVLHNGQTKLREVYKQLVGELEVDSTSEVTDGHYAEHVAQM